jgi:hypothetical protein
MNLACRGFDGDLLQRLRLREVEAPEEPDSKKVDQVHIQRGNFLTLFDCYDTNLCAARRLASPSFIAHPYPL